MLTWFKERFPVFAFITAAFLVLLPKAYFVKTQGLSWQWSGLDLAAFAASVTTLLLLRVFDEHKDFESDRINHPGRALQSGLVSLKDIRRLGVLAAVVHGVACAVLFSAGASVARAVLLWVWVGLMTKEFFCREFLRPRLFFYSLLHLFASPLLVAFLISVYSDESWTGDGTMLLMAVSLGTGWMYEIARKTKSPEEETTDPSFTRSWGLNGALIGLAVAGVLTSLAMHRLFVVSGINPLASAVTGGVLLVLLLLSLAGFKKQPTPKQRKSNEGVAGLFGLVAFVVPVVYIWLKS